MATLETTNISNEIKVTNDLSYYNEQLALKHATDAENSANRAKSEADKASASAGDVESSANRAKSEADKASASAAEAKSTLNSAVTTITNTKNSAISAIQAEGNVQRTSLQGYVDNAKSYANSASASASTATTKASEIVTSANNAKTYMTNAQSYMNTAKTYQDNALSYKNSAQTSASVATEQANLAKQYASSVDKESINISKMYTTGAVSTDTQGYNQLVEMKHSTFNKTGIDTIKADNYEVVGSPVISDDGVASGFSNSNYVKKDNVITIGSNGEFHIDFKSNCEHYTDLQYILDLYKTISDEIVIRRNIDDSYQCICFVSGEAIFNKSINIAEDNIEGYIEYKNNTYTLKINNSIETLISSVKMSALDYNLTFGCRGAYSNAQPLINGSIDLNSFKIYVDGNLVYQPCLKIPYTQSKTGSKIVDGGYRDRVQDLYEQTGTAPYYTLDEDSKDFTLPMGEIYGMIEQKNNMLNNPFTFGMSQYYKGEMKNLSWLKSYGQEYFKNGHPDFYNWVLTNANAGKKGFKLSTATDITDYDFVVNPTKETFTLPLKNGMEGVFASGVKGDGKSLGFTTGSKDFGLMETANQAVNNVFANRGAFNVPVGKFTPMAWDGEIDQALGVTTDPTKSGIVVDTTVPEGWNLYYYVGETVEGANLIKAGEVWEEISNKQDKCIHIVDTYVNGTSGYRIWSDGYCEQWGIVTMPNSAGVDVTLLKTLKDTNYAVMVTPARTYLGSAMGMGYNPNLSTTSKVCLVGFGISNNSPVCYVVKGYTA